MPWDADYLTPFDVPSDLNEEPPCQYCGARYFEPCLPGCARIGTHIHITAERLERYKSLGHDWPWLPMLLRHGNRIQITDLRIVEAA